MIGSKADYTRQVASIIRNQISTRVLWALGAHELAHTYDDAGPALTMKVRVLPFRKDGKRSTAARIMRLTVALTPADDYDIRVIWMRKYDIVEHVHYDHVPYENLNSVLLSIDSDHDKDE